MKPGGTWLLLTGLLLSGCFGDEPYGTIPTPDDLLSWLDQQREAQWDRTCPRAPLRDDPPPRPDAECGSPIDALLRPEPGSQTARCYAYLKSQDSGMRVFNIDDPVTSVTIPWGRRWQQRSPFADDLELDTLGRMVDECRDVVLAMRRAVNVTACCSPYGPPKGLEPPETAMPVFRLQVAAQAMGVHAARRGDTREALEILLDFVRLSQDFMRGTPEHLTTHVAHAAAMRVMFTVEMLLDEPRLVLSDADRKALAEQARRLIASEPDPYLYVESMHLGVGVQVSEPLLRGEPVEGVDLPPERALPGGVLTASGTWRSLTAIRSDCRTTATTEQCHGVRRVMQHIDHYWFGERWLDADEARADLVEGGLLFGLPQEVRNLVSWRATQLDTMENMARFENAQMLTLAIRQAQLTALATHLAVYRSGERDHRCPDEDTLRRRLADAPTEPWTGRPLRVWAGEPGGIRLFSTSRTWQSHRDFNPGAPIWRITCLPKAHSGPRGQRHRR